VAPSDVQSLYRQYGDEIRRYLVRRSRCADTAADLTQETFVRLLRGDDRMRIGSPRAYLYRIAANLLTDHARREGARPPTVGGERLDRQVDEAPDQERALLARDAERRLRRAIDEMPPRRREIFVLHKFEGMSYAEIAQRLGIAKNTVMVQMMQALAHCRERLADRD